MSIATGLEHILRENEPLAPYTCLNLGGVAEYFAEPTSETELVELVRRFSEQELPVRLIGSGSNILVRDEGVPGLVISLTAPDFCRLTVNENRIVASGGTKLSHFVSTAVREGFSGPENLVGLPGTIGGALHQNTGVNGYDIGSALMEARVMTRSGEVINREKDSLSFSYRQSSLDELVILNATFQYERENPEELTKRMQKLWIVRRSSQPVSESSIYVFKDSGAESASTLIEQSGLKGTRVGAVEVSDRDPNSFIAHEGATTVDVLRLIDLVKNQVSEKLGVNIESGLEVW